MNLPKAKIELLNLETTTMANNNQDKAQTKKCTVRYRTLALIFLISFFGIAVILCGTLTFTVTQYAPDIDIIYRVYGTFNPCILFDHYPANLVGLLGIIGWVTGNASCLIFLFIHTMLTKPDLSVMIKWCLLVGPLLFMYVSVVNVFSDNLYEHGYTKAPDYSGLNVTEYAKITANMTIDEIDGISKVAWEIVASHTSWFMYWMLADICYNVLYWQHMVRLGNTKYFPKPAAKGCRKNWGYQKFGKWLVCFLYFYGFIVFEAYMAVMVFSHDGNDRKHFEKKQISFVQSVFLKLRSVKPELWFFIIVVPNSLTMPAKVGFHFEFKLEKDDESKKGVSILQNGKWIAKHIYPANLISGAYKILCCLIVLTYLFKQVDINGTSIVMPLASGFKEKPFRYIFAPSWVILTGIVGLGTYLISVRETLSHRNSNVRVKSMQVVAILYVLMMLLGVWIIIPNTKIGGYMVAVAIILFPVWVGLAYGELHQTQNERIRLVIFFVLYSVFAATSPLHPVMNTLLLILLALFDQIVPEYKESDGLTMVISPVTFDGEEKTMLD